MLSVMNKLLATSLIVLDIISLKVLPLQAQNINSESKECQSAIASVEDRLKTGRQLTIEMSEMSDANASITPFKDRPNKYILGIGGNAAPSVMGSPVFSKSLATQIINNCDSVSSVSFGLWQSGWVNEYGLMSDGKIKIFECPKGFDDYPKVTADGEIEYFRDFKWGESCSM